MTTEPVKPQFAHKTAARLSAAIIVLYELTVMERATIRHQAIHTFSTTSRRVYFMQRKADAWEIRCRFPMPLIRRVLVDLCQFRCSGCDAVLTWAYVDSKLDGAPECPTCMQKYWEKWRRTLAFIFTEAVFRCLLMRPTDRAMAIADGLMLEGYPVWNPSTKAPT
jgi:NAD-dependent SIR2 family protein deacetylase